MGRSSIPSGLYDEEIAGLGLRYAFSSWARILEVMFRIEAWTVTSLILDGMGINVRQVFKRLWCEGKSY